MQVYIGSFPLNILGNSFVGYESKNREFVYERVDIVHGSFSNMLSTLELYHPHLGICKVPHMGMN